MKTSTILRRAKKKLDMHDRTDGVCLAIGRVGSGWHGELIKDVSDRIKPFAYAHQWLAHRMLCGRSKPKKTNEEWEQTQAWLNAQSHRNIQRWRLAWIDELIKEYEAKGD